MYIAMFNQTGVAWVMPNSPFIVINNLSFELPSLDTTLFHELNLSIGFEKTAIVGENGIGKSALLRLISGIDSPTDGSIETDADIAMLEQCFPQQDNGTIASILGIDDKLKALTRIRQGSADPEDFNTLADNWLVEDRAIALLSRFGLAHLSLDKAVNTLSGGEWTRLHLARIFMSEADFILLDEPTNNLDQQSRYLLYQEIGAFQGGLIIVSHDRSLLRRMDRIIELTTLGVSAYGCSYDDYLDQKQHEQAALERQLSDAQKERAKARAHIQKTKERQLRKQQKGRKQRADGSQPKIVLNAKREQSDSTRNQLSTRFARMEQQSSQQLSDVKNKLEVTKAIHIELPKTYVPNNKAVVRMEDVTFYFDNTRPLIHKFNLSIVGPERVAVSGPNGSGKSTLAKLICGQFEPRQGHIKRQTANIGYLDQNASMLDRRLTVIDNFKRLNPGLSEAEYRHRLAQLYFRNEAADKVVSELSGGETFRAMIACVLLGPEPVELLVLDEPTNHIDLKTLRAFESALTHFQGALLVISHDDSFIENIGINRQIDIQKQE